MHYLKDAPGDWGTMLETPAITSTTEHLAMDDGCKLFLRSWKTTSSDVLLILHGLGAHSGWFIDMGDSLASRGLNVYAVDHRGFGRSEGLAGHIDDYHTYLQDIDTLVTEVRKRHPGAKLYVLGHSMGAVFTAHYAAEHSGELAGVLFLNPWIEDTTHVPLLTLLQVFLGGFFKSKHYWRLAGGPEVMTTNPEAVQMLEADPYWRREETASFFVQIFFMRQAVLKKAAQISIPALVMQADNDKSVIPAASRKFFDALASRDKTWKTYPGYDHDSEFQADRSQMDQDIANWILTSSTSLRDPIP